MKFLKNKKSLYIIILILAIILLANIGIKITQISIKKLETKKQDEAKIEENIINVEVRQRLGNGFANILVKIESNIEIESVTFTNEDGSKTTVTPTKPRKTLTKDIRVALEQNYPVTVKTKDGQTFSKDIVIKTSISDLVNIGDFVNYSVGNWTEEDINKVGNYYSGSSLPTTSEKFGGFGVGQSKDNGINPTQYNANPVYNGGWRVLSKNSDGTINIVHAGTPEGYYVPRSVHNDSDLKGTINILGQYRNWTMYEDCSTDAVNTNYAEQGSAHCITTNEILGVNRNSTLRGIGVEYIYYYKVYYSSPFVFLGRIDANGYNLSSSLGNIGIRPVVTIKANVKATANEGQATHITEDTAWILSLSE
ncbi:MAG: hypothetical protein HFJ41_06885 [Clostridia bacterium]|nr:hypothetical protein [Clostridia bacterium]